MPAASTTFDFNLADSSVIDNGDHLIVSGRASTWSVDRVKDRVTSAAMTNALAAYMRNPVLLYNHKFDLAAGTVTKAVVDPDTGLWITAKLPRPSGGETLRWWTQVRDRVLRAFSIGGTFVRQTVKGIHQIVAMDLREISIAAVGVNSETLFGQQTFGQQMAKAFANGPDNVLDQLREVQFALAVASAELTMARVRRL